MAAGQAFFSAVANFSQAQNAARQLQAQLIATGTAATSSSGALNAASALVSRSANTQTASVSKLGKAYKALVDPTGHVTFGMKALANAVGSATRTFGPAAGAAAQFAVQMTAAHGAASGLTVALGALAAVTVGVGVRFLALRESAITAFTTILKDGAKAEDLMKRIVKTAAVTPFTTETLVAATRKLLTYGFTLEQVLKGAGKEASGIAITIGNAVAAVGGSDQMFQRVATAIGQIQTKGRVMGDELRQLAENGIPVFEILREKLGLTAKEVGRIGLQGISAKKAIGALQEGLDERFGDAMAKQSRTFIGLISTLKDSFQLLAAAASGGVFLLLKRSLTSLTDSLIVFAERAQKIGFMEALQERAPVVAGILLKIQDLFRALGEVALSAGPALKGFFDAFASGKLTIFNALMSTAIGLLKGFAAVISAIPEPVLQVVGALIAMRRVLQVLLAGRIVRVLSRLPLAFIAARQAALSMNGALMASGAASSLLGARAVRALWSIKALGSGIVNAMGGPVVATLAAVAAGLFYFEQRSAKARKAHDSVGEASKKLTDSLGIEKTAWEDLAKAVELTSDEQQKLAEDQARRKFEKDNANLIDQIKDLTDAASKLQAIKDVAINLVIEGAKPEDAFKALEALAAAVGIEIPVTLTARDLRSAEELKRSFESQARDLADSMKAALGDRLGTLLPTGLFGVTGPLKEDISSLATELQNLFNINPAQGIAAWQAMQVAIRSTAATEAEANNIITALSFAFSQQDAAVGELSPAFANLDTWLLQVAGGAKGVDAETIKLVQTILALKMGGFDTATALELLQITLDELPLVDVAGDAERVQKQLELDEKAAEAFDQAMKDLVSRSKEVSSAFDSFSNAGSALSSAFGDVTDDEEKWAKQTAKNAGLGEEAWEQFASGSIVSIAEYANALEAQLITQQMWGDNLVGIAQTYGPEVARELMKLGPQAAGIVEKMVNDTGAESQRLAELLRGSAAMSSEEFATEFEAGFSVLEEIIANPNITPDALSQKLGVPLEAIEPLLEKYGGLHGVAYAFKFGSALQNARFTMSTSQIDITGSPVVIPAVLRITAPGQYDQSDKVDPIDQYGGWAGSMMNFSNKGEVKPLPKNATIAKKMMLSWAEPQTKGEAFIPLGATNRNRSLEIWRETGKRLGAFKSYATGAVTGDPDDPASGGSAGKTKAQGSAYKNKVLDYRLKQLGKIRYGDSDKNGKGGSGSVAPVDQAALDAAEKLKDFLEAIKKELDSIEGNKLKVAFDLADTPTQLRMLQDRLKQLEALGLQFSDSWVEAWEQIEEIQMNQAEATKAAGDALRDLVNQEIELRQQLVDATEEAESKRAKATEDYNKRVADAQKRYQKSLTQEQQRYDERVLEQQKRVTTQTIEIEKRYAEALRQRSDAIIESIPAQERWRAAWANTTAAIVDNVRQQNVSFTEYEAGLAALRTRGISEDAISLLGLDSLTGLNTIKNLLSSTPAEFEELMAVIAERRRHADEIVASSSTDLAQQRDADLQALLSESATALAELSAEFADSTAELTADYNESLSELSADFQESIAEINADLLETQEEVNAELATLGTEGGVSYGEALAMGMTSAIPAVRAAADAYLAEISKLNAAVPAGFVNPVTGSTSGTLAAAAGNPPAVGGGGSGSGGGAGGYSSAVRGRPTLREGDTHAAVKAAKIWLNVNTGSSLYPEDEIFTPAMKWVLASFQNLMNGGNYAGDHGVLDDYTWGLMDYVGSLRGSPVPAFHRGGAVGMFTGRTKGDEMLARLQSGEGVLSADTMQRMTQAPMFEQLRNQPSTLNDISELEGRGTTLETLQPVIVTLDGREVGSFVLRTIKKNSNVTRRASGRAGRTGVS